MRHFLESISIKFLLVLLGITIVSFYLTKRYYYPSIPPPVKVDSAFINDLVPKVVINNDSCNHYVTVSLNEYNKKDFEASLRAAETALSFNGLNEYAHNNKCAALIALGRLEEALPVCERAVFLAPKFENAVANTRWLKSQIGVPVSK